MDTKSLRTLVSVVTVITAVVTCSIATLGFFGVSTIDDLHFSAPSVDRSRGLVIGEHVISEDMLALGVMVWCLPLMLGFFDHRERSASAALIWRICGYSYFGITLVFSAVVLVAYLVGR